MSAQRKFLQLLTTALFASIALASCNQPAEIQVACDVSDLIQAVNSANANTDTTKLVLAANCTYPFTAADNQDGGQGFNALPIVTTKIFVEGNDSTLLRSAAAGFRFFFITGTGSLRLEDVTLENGYALVSSNDQPNARGGAIFNDGGALDARRSVFRDNHAYQGEGGAIYNLGTLTLEENTLFEINSALDGGAIFSGGNVGIPAVFDDVRFEDNNAYDDGGAIYNDSAEAGFVITGSVFDHNSSYEHGGAIYMENGDLGISYSSFIGNQTGSNNHPAGDGGAIYALAADVTLHGCDFNLQTAYGVGGMIYAGQGSDLTLRESWGEENRACHGGGALYVEGETEILETTLQENRSGGLFHVWDLDDELYHDECLDAHGGAVRNDGILIIDRSLLADNRAWGDGDGVYNLGDLTVVNSTFHENVTEAINNLGDAAVSLSTFVGDGLYNSGNLTVKNIVVTRYPDGCVNTGTLVAMNENIARDSSCSFTTTLTEGYMFEMDFSLTNNGGPTLTHRVEYNSPMVNYASCITVAGDPVSVDQRGLARPYPAGSACDVGAFEVQDLSPTPEWPAPTQPPPPPPPPSDTPEPVTPMACAPQNTTCREGDSVDHEEAGYLLTGECAEVIGRNRDGTWLVINNPDWEGICWILKAIVETEGDVENAEVYTSAPPPENPPEEMGCLVQTERAGEPVCVVPCPEGASPGTPCEP
jgi:predicted outer membrane repeat protein